MTVTSQVLVLVCIVKVPAWISWQPLSTLSHVTFAAVLPYRAEKEYRALICLDMPQPKEARSQLLRGTQVSYVQSARS